MRSDRYEAWIQSYLRGVGRRPQGMCGAATAAMVLEFPKLCAVFGHVAAEGFDTEDESYPHWWCVTPDGRIVDPTENQFKRIFEYVEG